MDALSTRPMPGGAAAAGGGARAAPAAGLPAAAGGTALLVAATGLPAAAPDGPGASGGHLAASAGQDEALHALSGQMARAMAMPSGPEAEAERTRVRGLCDALYWEILDAWQGAPDGLGGAGPQAEERRLLADAGVMDSRLVPVGMASLIKAEWEEPSDGRVLYLTEWLQERRRAHRARLDLDAAPGATPAYVSHLGAARLRLTSQLGPLLAGLPGVSRDLAAEFQSGRLDTRLLAMGAALLARGSRGQFLRRSRLRDLRDGLLAKLRQRAGQPAERQCLDLLQGLYRREWAERFHQAEEQARGGTESGPAGTAGAGLPADPAESLRAALSDDLSLLRRSAERAAGLAGEERAGPSCWTDQPRSSRQAAAQALDASLACGRDGHEPPRVVLLPLLGRGACAWDLNALVVALRPSAGVEDAVATALGEWHVRADAEQRGGAMAKAFAAQFAGVDFASEFPGWYRLWLCRTAKGDAEALSPAQRAFFREHVGPPLSGPVIPPNLRNLSAQTRLALRQRIERLAGGQGADANLHRRLGALCWMDGLPAEACRHFTSALRCDPADGEAALSLGLAFRADGQEDNARSILEMGADRAGPSLWGLYCRDLAQDA